MNHLADQIIAATPNRELRCIPRDRLDSCDRSKMFRSASVICGEDDRSLWAVTLNQPRRAVDIDNTTVFDDCDPIAQPLGFLHEMCSQKNRLASPADSPHQVPDGSASLRVQPRG